MGAMKSKPRSSDWAPKVMALIKGGNVDAALAQIKVAPSVKDLQQLQKAMLAAPMPPGARHLVPLIEEHLALLSAPRLHRSP